MRLVVRLKAWLAKAVQGGLFGSSNAQLVPQVKVVTRGGKTHTQIYWVDPSTGMPAHKETRAGAVKLEDVGAAPKGPVQGTFDFDAPAPKPEPKPAPKPEPKPQPKPDVRDTHWLTVRAKQGLDPRELAQRFSSWALEVAAEGEALLKKAQAKNRMRPDQLRWSAEGNNLLELSNHISKLAELASKSNIPPVLALITHKDVLSQVHEAAKVNEDEPDAEFFPERQKHNRALAVYRKATMSSYSTNGRMWVERGTLRKLPYPLYEDLTPKELAAYDNVMDGKSRDFDFMADDGLFALYKRIADSSYVDVMFAEEAEAFKRYIATIEHYKQSGIDTPIAFLQAVAAMKNVLGTKALGLRTGEPTPPPQPFRAKPPLPTITPPAERAPEDPADLKSAAQYHKWGQEVLERGQRMGSRELFKGQTSTARRDSFKAAAAEQASATKHYGRVLLKMAEQAANGTLHPLLRNLDKRAAEALSDYAARYVDAQARGEVAAEQTLMQQKAPYIHRYALIHAKSLIQNPPPELSAQHRTVLRKALAHAQSNETGTFPVSKNLALIEALKALAKTPQGSKDYSLRQNMDWVRSAEALVKSGIATDMSMRAAIIAMAEIYSSAYQAPDPALGIKLLESQAARSNIPGYFPTPKALVERMIEEADIQPGMQVLEPSAGSGAIAEEVAKIVGSANVHNIEPSSSLRKILELKQLKVLPDTDFLQHTGRYDRIVMNPPFENSQDITHVQHAYEQLAPGGKLVAITSSGPFFRSDSKARGFRDWLEAVGGWHEPLPEGSFKHSDRTTMVNTHMVVIEKPFAKAPSRQLRSWLAKALALTPAHP